MLRRKKGPFSRRPKICLALDRFPYFLLDDSHSLDDLDINRLILGRNHSLLRLAMGTSSSCGGQPIVFKLMVVDVETSGRLLPERAPGSSPGLQLLPERVNFAPQLSGQGQHLHLPLTNGILGMRRRDGTTMRMIN